MGKSKELEPIDVSKFKTIDEVDAEMARHKDILVGKDKTEFRIKEEKKDLVKSHNDLLKELTEERSHELGVLEALKEHRRRLVAGKDKIIPITSAKKAQG